MIFSDSRSRTITLGTQPVSAPCKGRLAFRIEPTFNVLEIPLPHCLAWLWNLGALDSVLSTSSALCPIDYFRVAVFSGLTLFRRSHSPFRYCGGCHREEQ